MSRRATGAGARSSLPAGGRCPRPRRCRGRTRGGPAAARSTRSPTAYTPGTEVASRSSVRDEAALQLDPRLLEAHPGADRTAADRDQQQVSAASSVTVGQPRRARRRLRSAAARTGLPVRTVILRLRNARCSAAETSGSSFGHQPGERLDHGHLDAEGAPRRGELAPRSRRRRARSPTPAACPAGGRARWSAPARRRPPGRAASASTSRWPARRRRGDAVRHRPRPPGARSRGPAGPRPATTVIPRALISPVRPL